MNEKKERIKFLMIPGFLFNETYNINSEERELFAYIAFHSLEEGFCYARNSTIGAFFKKSERTIIRMINHLEEIELIIRGHSDYGTDKNGKPIIISRKLFLNKSNPSVLDFISWYGKTKLLARDTNVTPTDKNVIGDGQKWQSTTVKNVTVNNKDNNISIKNKFDELSEQKIESLLF